jgi:hypothetical protein
MLIENRGYLSETADGGSSEKHARMSQENVKPPFRDLVRALFAVFVHCVYVGSSVKN